jgi:uroporphyrinogen III methyltransferase/synthase
MKKLDGKRILVTSEIASGRKMSQLLRANGADPIEFPMIQIVPLEDDSELNVSIKAAYDGDFDWIIFTSKNAVDFFLRESKSNKKLSDESTQSKIAAVGPSTAASLLERGEKVDFIPENYVAEEIVAGLGDVNGKRILLPRANIARRNLPEMLKARGAHVEDIAAYQTKPAFKHGTMNEFVPGLIRHGGIDIITFASSSAVHQFVEWCQKIRLDLSAVDRIDIACIGPITEKAVLEKGLKGNIVASEHTIEGLVDAIAKGVN